MPTDNQQKLDGWVSVTEVLGQFIPRKLLDWYLKTGKKEAKRLSTVAMKIGTRVNELIDEDVLKGSITLTSKDSIEVKNCIESWKQFKQDYQPNIQAVQVSVKDDVQKVVGHIDLIMDNRVCDIKCASSIKPDHWIQTAKYRAMGYGQCVGLSILRLDKNLGTYEFKTHEQAGIDPVQCVKVFDGLLEAFRYYNAPKEQEESCQML